MEGLVSVFGDQRVKAAWEKRAVETIVDGGMGDGCSHRSIKYTLPMMCEHHMGISGVGTSRPYPGIFGLQLDQSL
jgi:hypothetical protein